MNTKYTQGPWRVGYLEYVGLAIKATADKADDHVAQLSAELSSGDMSANAYLIAAAPEMLETLKDAKRWIETLPDNIVGGSIMPEKLAAIITKAEGKK